jgi:carboxylesterase type B
LEKLPFVWGYSPGNTFTPEEQILSDNITSWWSNFASSGNPNGFPALPGWPKYSSKLPDRLVLNCGNTEYITQYRETQCEFWRSYYSIYYAPAFESNPVNLLNIKNIWRHFVESRM